MALNSHSSLYEGLKEAVMIVFAIVLLTALVIASAAKYQSNSLITEASLAQPSQSLQEAKAKGTFVSKATLVPRSFQYGDEVLAVQEAWIERRVRKAHLLIWFPYEREVGHQLCFTLEKLPVPETLPLIFLNSDQQVAFSRPNRGNLFWHSVPQTRLRSFSVELLLPAKAPVAAEKNMVDPDGKAPPASAAATPMPEPVPAEDVPPPPAIEAAPDPLPEPTEATPEATLPEAA